MDFLNANARAPWSFVGDTDPEWNVKVVAEEANFLDRHVPAVLYDDDRFLGELRALGIDDRDALGRFVHALADVGAAGDWDLETVAAALSALGTPMDVGEPTAADLERFATAWVADVAEFADLANWLGQVDADRAVFGRRVREFRRERPWLRADVDPDGGEVFDRVHPADGTVVYYGYRRSPDGEGVLFVGNMEGAERTVDPTGLDERIPEDGWTAALARTPGGDAGTVDGAEPVTLANGDAVVWTRSS